MEKKPLYPIKSPHDVYLDALPSYLEALGRNSETLPTQVKHPTPRERMLAAKAKGSIPT
jgi:hypothetical protein